MKTVAVIYFFILWSTPVHLLKFCCGAGDVFNVFYQQCDFSNDIQRLPKIQREDGTIEVVTPSCYAAGGTYEEEHETIISDGLAYLNEKEPTHWCLGQNGSDFCLANYLQKIDLPSCCEEGHVLDEDSDECVKNDTNSKFAEVHFQGAHNNVQYGPEDFNWTVRKTCSEPSSIKYVSWKAYSNPPFVLDYHNQHLVIIDTHEANYRPWKKDEFCVSTSKDGYPLVRLCYSNSCQGRTCIKKCCEEGKVYNLDEGRCVESDVERVNVTVLDEHRNAIYDNVKEIYAHVPLCHLHVPEETQENLTRIIPISENGTFWIDNNGLLFHEAENFTTDKYCVETAISNNSEAPSLMAIYCPAPTSELDSRFWEYVTFGLMCFSSFFLLVIIIVHLLLKDLHTVYGISITCHSLSLFISFMGLAFMRINVKPSGYNACLVFAYFVHYFLIASFSWLTAIAFNFFWMFSDFIFLGNRMSSRDFQKLLWYHAWSWGVPLLVTVLAAIDETTRLILFFGGCWFTGDIYRNFILIPIAILLTVNLVLIGITAYQLRVATTVLTPTQKSGGKEKFWTTVKLFILAGLNWFAEVLHAVWDKELYDWLKYALSFFIISVPFLVFLLVIVNRRVFDLFGLSYNCIGEFFSKHGWRAKTRGYYESRKSRSIKASVRSKELRVNGNRKISMSFGDSRRFTSITEAVV